VRAMMSERVRIAVLWVVVAALAIMALVGGHKG